MSQAQPTKAAPQIPTQTHQTVHTALVYIRPGYVHDEVGKFLLEPTIPCYKSIVEHGARITSVDIYRHPDLEFGNL